MLEPLIPQRFEDGRAVEAAEAGIQRLLSEPRLRGKLAERRRRLQFGEETSPGGFKDFSAGDTIAIAKSTFSGIGPRGVLKAEHFHGGSQAETRDQHILYDKKSGWLLYAKRGELTVNPQELVKVGKHLKDFDHQDILVI